MRVIEANIISDNLKLKGELYFPEVSRQARPAICLCHGISAGPYNPADRSWSELGIKFCNAGFISLIFKFRGAGLSEGNFDILDWARDLQNALEFLLSFQEVDRQRIFVLGSSAGGAAGIYVAAHDNRIKGVVTLGCPAKFNFINLENLDGTIKYFRNIGIIKDDNFPPSREEWLKHFEIITPLNWISLISPRPILIMHGEKDDVVPLEQGQELYNKAGQPKDFIIVPDAGHRLRLIPEVIDRALNWLKIKAELIK